MQRAYEGAGGGLQAIAQNFDSRVLAER
jgi:hypothetical protein